MSSFISCYFKHFYFLGGLYLLNVFFLLFISKENTLKHLKEPLEITPSFNNGF